MCCSIARIFRTNGRSSLYSVVAMKTMISFNADPIERITTCMHEILLVLNSITDFRKIQLPTAVRTGFFIDSE